MKIVELCQQGSCCPVVKVDEQPAECTRGRDFQSRAAPCRHRVYISIDCGFSARNYNLAAKFLLA